MVSAPGGRLARIREGGAAFGGGGDVGQVGVRRGGCSAATRASVVPVADDGEEVAEVVGHARRELP